MNVQTNEHEHAFQAGYHIIETKGTAVVGMSPGNSYFNLQTIQKLLTECTKRFSRIIILIPDIPAIHTYKAIGYADNQAQRKAKHQSNALLNRIHEILPIIQQNYSGELIISTWDSPIVKNPAFTGEYTKIMQLYESNTTFKEDVRNTTKSVIENKLKPGRNLEQSLDEGVTYLLSEFAFITTCAKIYNTSIAYVYHHSWEIYQKFVNGAYDQQKNQLGFVIMNEQ